MVGNGGVSIAGFAEEQFVAAGRMAIELKTENTESSNDFAVTESCKAAQGSRGYDDGVILTSGKSRNKGRAFTFPSRFN